MKMSMKQSCSTRASLTNSLDASSDKTALIVSHIVRMESGPKQFSGVLLSVPPSPAGDDGLAGEEAMSLLLIHCQLKLLI